ncbi:hypothetical protein, partial [Borborobacter arsenicus]|uniref:hypothetical protein n=1 Tax=Borborobacter arsenicus TaxID=1851146 RepID=UPI001AEC9716
SKGASCASTRSIVSSSAPWRPPSTHIFRSRHAHTPKLAEATSCNIEHSATWIIPILSPESAELTTKTKVENESDDTLPAFRDMTRRTATNAVPDDDLPAGTSPS